MEELNNIDVSSPHALNNNLKILNKFYKDLYKNENNKENMYKLLDVVACLSIYFKEAYQIFLKNKSLDDDEIIYLTGRLLLFKLYNNSTHNSDTDDTSDEFELLFEEYDIDIVEFCIQSLKSTSFDKTLYEQGKSINDSMINIIDYSRTRPCIINYVINDLFIDKEDLETEDFIEFALSNKLDIFSEHKIQFEDKLYNNDSIINYCLKNKINMSHIDFKDLKNNINFIDSNTNSVLMNFIERYSDCGTHTNTLTNFLSVENLDYNYQNKDGNTAFHIFISLINKYTDLYTDAYIHQLFMFFLKYTNYSIISNKESKTVMNICPGNYLSYFSDHELSAPIKTFFTTECSICLGNLSDKVLTLRCGHIFHNECIMKCKCCPLCRKE